ncbi:fibroleukin-like isoform X1 [Sycon ciliatum]|uniref:fibroleukin-like isoform X1 n=1 Tax=Sycon ciliatum TaxID=27933 RepID=UPI0031F60445
MAILPHCFMSLLLLAMTGTGAYADLRGERSPANITSNSGQSRSGTCMVTWIKLHDPTMSDAEAQVKQDVLESHSAPMDETNTASQRVVLFSFLFGGVSKARSFIQCLSREDETCGRQAPCGEHGQCVYGAIASAGHRAYHCKCASGFTGSNCERERSPCSRAPCGNAGRCVPLPAGAYRCSCSKFWTGRHCSQARWVTKGELSPLSNAVRSIVGDVSRMTVQISDNWKSTETFLQGMEKRLMSRLDDRLDAIAANISNNTLSIQSMSRAIEEIRLKEAESGRCVRQSGATTVRSSRTRVVTANVHNTSFQTVCNMSVDGGGWLVVLRSLGPDSTFWNRDWAAYKNGFGDLNGKFWLGNDRIHTLTQNQTYEVRIDLATRTATHFVKYNWMRVESEEELYRLTVSRTVESSFTIPAGQGLEYHEMPFTTHDRDNDSSPHANCATQLKIGWWYAWCYYVLHDRRFSPALRGLTFFEMKVRLRLP